MISPGFFFIKDRRWALSEAIGGIGKWLHLFRRNKRGIKHKFARIRF